MIRRICRQAALAALIVLVAGCAQVTQIAAGDSVVVRERMLVKLDKPWNQLERTPVPTAAVWTVDGVYVDALQFFVGIKDGTAIAPALPGAKEQRPLTFRAAMEPHEIVALYEAMWTRDGSTFKLLKLEPADFLQGKGFSFEYEVVRKADDVRMKGRAWGAVRGQELFVINYSAPRLGFYPRTVGDVERIVQSARLRG